LIIRLIIQTILLYPSGAVWTDGPSNVSRLDPSGAVQIDAEHPSRNRKVEDEAGRTCWLPILVVGRLREECLGALGTARFNQRRAGSFVGFSSGNSSALIASRC
jgi:hypothetical protein